ncbi:dihydropteroate synthase [Desulfitobacterium sp.]|uniref:dihydropteroate synthase n=1 Tax=Desulfitobacterium sp. TaxID=49981 RepID=UPI002B20A7A2|nr:dihydropteroate synthase [Desulfitobacterium sp.]MEA4902855.1 dihydropteroate synthase [Desulfitobacterium sp.]
MKEFQMRWIKLDNLEEAKRAIAQIGSDSGGIAFMAGKSLGKAIKVENVPLPAAHILKQEMLSVGGDAAVHRNVIVNKVEATDVLLLGTVRQFEQFAQKILAQPFGLKELGQQLKALLKGLEPPQERTLACRGRELVLGKRTLVMGILNVTPDSFSDGGRYVDLKQAVSHAEQMIEEGADLIDIGAESTRPGTVPISAQEEWSRLEPVLKELLPRTTVPISLDTYKAEVAEKGLEAGVNIINDIWGLQGDPDMARVVGKYHAPVIVMHNQKELNYHHLLGDMMAFFRRSIQLAEENGLSRDEIIVDPGIGFAKTREQDLEVMSRLDELKSLGHPILLAASRKRLIGHVLDLPVDQRLEGTIATSVAGVAAGVDMIRVHDVLANRRAIDMADAIYRRLRGRNFAGA